MSSTDSATRPSRKYGPIQIISTPFGYQLLGFVVAFIGIQLISWVVDGVVTESTVLSSTVLYTAIGTFAIFNGLYLGGVRFR
jgi:hypothetical protein